MKKILVVEDHDSARFLYQEELTEAGYDVLAAADGQEALDLLQKQKIDLLITDIKMPHISGAALINQLHSTDPKLPVIVVSAFKQYAEPLAPNIKSFFLKPINFTVFKQVVADLLGEEQK